MIQRVQTIYLALAFICMVLMLFFPVYSIHASTETDAIEVVFGAYGLQDGNIAAGRFPVYLIYIILALLTLTGIFLYKNRPRQLMITRINLILHIILTIGLYLFYYVGKSFVSEALTEAVGENAEVQFSMEAGLYLLTATIPFLILAIRGIKRDEMLVKSLDRLR